MVIPRVLIRASNLVHKSVSFNQFNLKNSYCRLLHTTRCMLKDRLYTDKHEWVEVDGTVGTIGVSQYAQEALGDIVYAQLPDVDTVVKQKDECGALESVKAASEIYTPVSGKITAKNTEVEDAPSLINSSCYEKGWLFKLELSNADELKGLMTQEQYEKYLKSDESH